MEAASRYWLAGFGSLAFAALSGACSESDDGVTYAGDVQPIFDQRCTLCHQPGAKFGPGTLSGPNILDPFSPDEGLLVAVNQWASPRHPELLPRLVVPGEPDRSALLLKLDEAALPPDSGGPMPFRAESITEDELRRVVTWVQNGAQPNEEYYGVEGTDDTGINGIFMNANPSAPGKCDTCHYAGAPNPPDLSDPFGPDGLVNVTAIYRRDMLRVAPEDPEASLLVQRLRQSYDGNQPSSEFGAPMPKQFPALTAGELAIVRQWIVEGARP